MTNGQARRQEARAEHPCRTTLARISSLAMVKPGGKEASRRPAGISAGRPSFSLVTRQEVTRREKTPQRCRNNGHECTRMEHG